MSHFEPDLDQNEPEMGTWMALPDPGDDPVDWACWQCQADGPEFSLELTREVDGKGWTYRICAECAVKLLGQLEEGRPERG